MRTTKYFSKFCHNIPYRTKRTYSEVNELEKIRIRKVYLGKMRDTKPEVIYVACRKVLSGFNLYAFFFCSLLSLCKTFLALLKTFNYMLNTFKPNLNLVKN